MIALAPHRFGPVPARSRIAVEPDRQTTRLMNKCRVAAGCGGFFSWVSAAIRFKIAADKCATGPGPGDPDLQPPASAPTRIRKRSGMKVYVTALLATCAAIGWDAAASSSRANDSSAELALGGLVFTKNSY